jgi:hypothetical protein
MPETPEAISSIQVTYDQPQVQKLVVRQSFQAELEAKGENKEAA